VAGNSATAYARIVAGQVSSQAQYRTSFVVDLAGTAGFGALDLLSVLVTFRVTRTLGGFTLPAVLLMTVLAGLGFSVADLVVGNIERIRVYVRTGLLDAILVRPLGALPQLLATDFTPRRVGRVAVYLALLPVAIRLNHVSLTPARTALLVLAPLAGAVLFGSVFVASATVAFWWIDSGEFANAATYGGRDFAGYPMNVYNGFFRRFFAYGLGYAFVGYYPALALLGRRDPLGAPAWLGWAAPLVAAAAASAAGLLWRTAIRHYRSTGS